MQTTELAEIDHEPTELAVVNGHHATDPTEERNRAVADLLAPGYANASTLKLTKNESKSLTEPFPDEAFSLGAGGDPDLVYLSHVYLRERLTTVLGVGAAVFVRRREWTEKFTYKDKYNKMQDAARVYVDLVLLVRGCVVGEAIGDSTYYPTNAKSNYSDALESAKSNALRRCCKEFGIGLEPWKKGWCDAWKQRQRDAMQAILRGDKKPPEPPPQSAAPNNPPSPVNPSDAVMARAREVISVANTQVQFDRCDKRIGELADKGDIDALQCAELSGLLAERRKQVVQEIANTGEAK
jgi:hypothetical protein